MGSLEKMDWNKIRHHYDERVAIHRELLCLFDTDVSKFVKLLLAVKIPAANYSADTHHLGPKILSEAVNRRAEERVFELAKKLIQINNCLDIPTTVRSADIRYLGISVGSEMACMLKPDVCWVTNIRTVAANLWIKHVDNIGKVREELALYRDGDQESEVAYTIWCDLHKGLDTAMTRISEMGSSACKKANVAPGEFKYLWADCVANELFESYFS